MINSQQLYWGESSAVDQDYLKLDPDPAFQVTPDRIQGYDDQKERKIQQQIFCICF